MKLLVCGGGTGGHVYPALAVVEVLQNRSVRLSDMLWVGTHGEMETELVPREGIALRTIPGGPIAGMPRTTQVKNAAKLAAAVGSSLRLIRGFKPDVALLTGGYVNLPVALATKLTGVPTAVYLPDVEPGSAIRRIQPLVQKIACTTEDSAEFLPASKLVPTGYPVRSKLVASLKLTVADARSQLELDATRPTLFIFGGSRGAQSINRALMAILPELLTFAQVIHVSGTLTWNEVAANAETLEPALRSFYKPFPYLHEEMGVAFRAADLVVARAGASMLGECPAFGVPAILVPYPHAWRYQKVNADYLAARNAGIRINDDEMATKLLPTVQRLFDDRQALDEMKQAAQALARPDAAANIAKVLEDLGS